MGRYVLPPSIDLVNSVCADLYCKYAADDVKEVPTVGKYEEQVARIKDLENTLDKKKWDTWKGVGYGAGGTAALGGVGLLLWHLLHRKKKIDSDSSE